MSFGWTCKVCQPAFSLRYSPAAVLASRKSLSGVSTSARQFRVDDDVRMGCGVMQHLPQHTAATWKLRSTVVTPQSFPAPLSHAPLSNMVRGSGGGSIFRPSRKAPGSAAASEVGRSVLSEGRQGTEPATGIPRHARIFSADSCRPTSGKGLVTCQT